jgi:hypothetical protein
MKHLKYYPIVLFTLVVFITGCSKDFLDLKPIAQPSEVSYYIDSASIDVTATAAYAELCARDVFDRDYYLTIGSIPSDYVECGGEGPNDFPEAQHIDQLLNTKTDISMFDDEWNYCYKGCRMINTALEKMPIVKKNYPDKISDQFIASRTAEMKFLRAFYHFTLVQVFGGVPIAKELLLPAQGSNPKNSIAEVLHFCEQDLLDAIPSLQLLNPGQVGRATKGAAQALLARVYLFESSYAQNYPTDDRFKGCTLHWQDALNNAEAVINSGVYKLVGSDPGSTFVSWHHNFRANDGYRWLFTASADNSSEGIFEIQSVPDGHGWGMTRGNDLTVYTTIRKYTKPDGTVGDVGGWSFNCPTDYLVQAFRNSDPRESNLHSTPGPVGSETDDARFKTTVGRAGDSVYINGNKLVPMNFDNLPTHMIGRKFECSFAEFWKASPVFEGPFNIRLIRLGEVILEAAEASYMLNPTPTNAKALGYVNKVRSRARNCGTTGSPADLTAISFEDIVHERTLELTLEPYRFFDLVRWGLAYKYINGIPNGAMGASFSTVFEKGKHEFFPLPDDQVQLSKGGLKQYPAWE